MIPVYKKMNTMYEKMKTCIKKVDIKTYIQKNINH